jgi:hypothetical protein
MKLKIKLLLPWETMLSSSIDRFNDFKWKYLNENGIKGIK